MVVIRKKPKRAINSDFSVKSDPVFNAGKGISLDLIKMISKYKNEPDWIKEFRINSFELYKKVKMPDWGCNLTNIDFDNIHYYVRPSDKPAHKWDDVPTEIKETFDRLGVPQAERGFLAGTGAQFESEIVYHNLDKKLEKQGVIFESIDDALKNHPKLFKEYFGTVVPPTDNKFAALNSAVWSGGSFIYVPPGVDIELPLQAYFRINAESMGQFERTLIIADEGARVHYIEGCTAPTYSTDALHAAVVEVIVKRGARVQYSTVQNWSNNVYNLVTKRAKVFADGEMFWLDCNMGSKVTMKYPASVLMEEGASAQVHSVAFADKDQILDAGAKMIHLAPRTSSVIHSKSISKNGGISSYRGLVKVVRGAHSVKSKVICDALLMDGKSRSDTYPTMDVFEKDVTVEHEATVSKIGDDQLFYLMSRGLSEKDSSGMIVNGFLDPIVRKLPMEYAVEMNRLITP